jgi:hypothetical protein
LQREANQRNRLRAAAGERQESAGTPGRQKVRSAAVKNAPQRLASGHQFD